MFWNKKILDDNIGKPIIKFKCDGCMANIHNFEFIGTIVERLEPIKGVTCKNNFNYRVRIEKDSNGYELRNNPNDIKYQTIPAWYIQQLEGNYLIVYD